MTERDFNAPSDTELHNVTDSRRSVGKYAWRGSIITLSIAGLGFSAYTFTQAASKNTTNPLALEAIGGVLSGCAGAASLFGRNIWWDNIPHLSRNRQEIKPPSPTSIQIIFPSEDTSTNLESGIIYHEQPNKPTNEY